MEPWSSARGESIKVTVVLALHRDRTSSLEQGPTGKNTFPQINTGTLGFSEKMTVRLLRALQISTIKVSVR